MTPQSRLERLPPQMRKVVRLVAEVFEGMEWYDEDSRRWYRLLTKFKAKTLDG